MRRGEIVQKLGVKMVDVHHLYHGLSTIVRRPKKVITKGVKEKLLEKLQGWMICLFYLEILPPSLIDYWF